tara:strand:- start:569 stop:805 length:237 start_codon:yes stop_codon:yes gene_type:complete
MTTKHVAQRVRAPRTTNGNSRTGWLIHEIHDLGFPVEFITGYNDFKETEEKYPDAVFLDYEIRVKATEYRNLKKEYSR